MAQKACTRGESVKIGELRIDDLMYPSKNDGLRKLFYEPLEEFWKKTCKESASRQRKGYCGILLDNAVKVLLGVVRKFPDLEVELLAKSWVDAASKPEVVQCFLQETGKERKECVEKIINKVIESARQMQVKSFTTTANIQSQGLKGGEDVFEKFVKRLEGIFSTAAEKYGKEFLDSVARELCIALGELSRDVSSLCDAALKSVNASIFRHEIISKVRQRISGRDIAKLIREDREAR